MDDSALLLKALGKGGEGLQNLMPAADLFPAISYWGRLYIGKDDLFLYGGDLKTVAVFKDWWCVAGPVKDPEGGILGYLDISLHAEKELGLAAALLQTLINSIEREFLLLKLSQSEQTDLRVPVPPSIPLEIAAKLTPREREVLELLLSGLTNEEVAQKLHISPFTVKTHRQNAYEKLRISSISELRAKLGWYGDISSPKISSFVNPVAGGCKIYSKME